MIVGVEYVYDLCLYENATPDSHEISNGICNLAEIGTGNLPNTSLDRNS